MQRTEFEAGPNQAIVIYTSDDSGTDVAPATVYSAVATGPLESECGAWAREHLADDVVGWLVTVAPNGRVQASAISFLWDGATILFYSKPGTPKLRNIAAHPQVSFHLNSDPYADHILVIEGVAEVEPDHAPSDAHPAYAAKYHSPLEHWAMDEAQTAREFSVAVRITPTRIRAY
jgi:PPOX class probable F420-dependent enzyme